MHTFRLTDTFIEQFKDKPVKWGFGALSHFTYKRTYAREKSDGTRERWYETVRRVVEGTYQAQLDHCEKNCLPFDMGKAQRSAQRMYQLIFDFKFTPPGRGLEHMGASSVKAKGGAILNNCGFVSTANIAKDFADPFCFLMDFSALGVGIGFDTLGAGAVTIKGDNQSKSVDFVIQDSREGWVNAMRALLESMAYCKPRVEFDYSCIRPEGAILKTLGGTASGPEPLRQCIERTRSTLEALRGQLITSVAIVDIMNFIGCAIVAGGTRRSAEIALGDPSDQLFIDMKNRELFPQEMDDFRWASNNTVVARDGAIIDYDRIVDTFAGSGEPGIFWVDNARAYGRMVDAPTWNDAGVMGVNPCAEQPLFDHELCTLAELYPANHDSIEDVRETIKYAYLYAKSVTLIPTHDPRVNAVMQMNRRIGLSQTGEFQAFAKFGRGQFISKLGDWYEYVRELDAMYSDWLCVPRSRKVTTVKPSGTISLVAGSTPGMHAPHSPYSIRRVRVQRTSPVWQAMKDAGYDVEESAYGDKTMVVSFPVDESFVGTYKADLSALEQLELAATMQAYWSDNGVSVTVTFKPDELPAIKRALPLYAKRLKAVSFLPYSDHGYVQAPYEAITKERYEEMASQIKPVDFDEVYDRGESDKFCEGDKCLIGS